MPLGLFGSLFNSIVGSANTESTNRANARENEKNRQFNHDEAELAHQRNIELMNMQNEYNSFANQRKLMEQAGFNPNLMVGGASGIARASGSSGSPQASSGSAIPRQAFTSLLDPSLISALSQADLNKAQTDKIRAETEGQSLQNEYQSVFNDNYFEFGRDIMKTGLDYTQTQDALAQADKMLKDKSWETLDYDLKNLKPLEVSNRIATNLLTITQAEATSIKAIKDETERQIAIGEYLVGLQVSASVIAANNAKAYHDNMMGNAWNGNLTGSNGGVLYRGAQHDNNLKRQQYIEQKKLYEETYKDVIKYIKRNLKKEIGLTDYEIRRYGLEDPHPYNGGFYLWGTERTAQSFSAPTSAIIDIVKLFTNK